MKDVVIFDLDGTLALIGHRRHFVENGNKQWDAFHAACVDDAPNSAIISIFHALDRMPMRLWIVSGRTAEVLHETEAWLKKYEIYFDQLIMRPAKDYTPDDVLKRKWLNDGTLPKDRIAFVFDDRDRVVNMWREEGLTCLQVAPGNF